MCIIISAASMVSQPLNMILEFHFRLESIINKHKIYTCESIIYIPQYSGLNRIPHSRSYHQ